MWMNLILYIGEDERFIHRMYIYIYIIQFNTIETLKMHSLHGQGLTRTHTHVYRRMYMGVCLSAYEWFHLYKLTWNGWIAFICSLVIVVCMHFESIIVILRDSLYYYILYPTITIDVYVSCPWFYIYIYIYSIYMRICDSYICDSYLWERWFIFNEQAIGIYWVTILLRSV